MSEPVRHFVDPDTGERYTVRQTPRERTSGRGVNPAVSSPVFETEAGEWVGELPVFAPFRLQATAERDLKVMLERATQREQWRWRPY